MSSDPSALSAGAIVADRFRVIRLLGAGGMGAVYEVEHELTKHRRALKLLHRSCLDQPEVVGRFVREASAAGRIGSRHIVETFDAGQLPGGEPYLVMELLRGEALSEVLERKGRLELDLALEIVRQAAVGIQAAHDVGIVHRDLKPENLFLLEGPEPVLKILDFGISRFDPELTGTPSLTTDGTTLGTPYYMSPEQVRGGEGVDGQADVYALGVVLYECLTGKPPFHAETLPALCVLIHEGKYQPPRALRPDLPQAVEDVITTAMERDRKRRYPSARGLADALADVLAGKSISFGDTLAVPSTATPTVRRPQAEARSIAPLAAPEISEKTQLSSDASRANGGSRRSLYAAAGVLAAAALGFALFQSMKPERTAPSHEPAPPETMAAPPPPLAPVVPRAAEITTPDAAAPSVQSGRVVTPPPASSKPRAQNKRAKEHGLGTEDPF